MREGTPYGISIMYGPIPSVLRAWLPPPGPIPLRAEAVFEIFQIGAWLVEGGFTGMEGRLIELLAAELAVRNLGPA
jgi:hypothetical protein